MEDNRQKLAGENQALPDFLPKFGHLSQIGLRDLIPMSLDSNVLCNEKR